MSNIFFLLLGIELGIYLGFTTLTHLTHQPLVLVLLYHKIDFHLQCFVDIVYTNCTKEQLYWLLIKVHTSKITFLMKKFKQDARLDHLLYILQ